MNDTLNQIILTEDISTLSFINRYSVSLVCFELIGGKHLPKGAVECCDAVMGVGAMLSAGLLCFS